MLRGLYSAATAMNAATLNQEVVAENLAQSVTPGYRRQTAMFETLLPGSQPGQLSQGGVVNTGHSTYFDSGPVQQSGNPLDVAISGDAFFVLEGPTGPVYTRNGTFEINAEGQLQSKGGMPVRGQGGPITIPRNYSNLVIGTDGTITINGNTQAGKIDLATFDDNNTLRRVGNTLFQGDGAQPPPPGQVRLNQGYREGSNVQPVQEMIAMILGMRHYEAAEKTMRAMAEALSQNTKPQG